MGSQYWAVIRVEIQSGEGVIELPTVPDNY